MATETDLILRIPARYRDTWDGFLSLAISAIESTDESTWSADERELVEALREDKWASVDNTKVSGPAEPGSL